MINIVIDIDIDKANLENINIAIDIEKDNLENIDIDKDYLENIDIDIDKDILGKKIIFSADLRLFSCFFGEISIWIVDILAFFEISIKYQRFL